MYDQDDQFVGGTALYQVTDFNGSLLTSENFYIAGANPPFSSITALEQQQGAPWWYGKALSRESSNRQFVRLSQLSGDSSYGGPVFGPPDGFGLTQLDASGIQTDIESIPGKLRSDDLWNWAENLVDGIILANNVIQPAATSYWNNQNANMYRDTGGNNAPPQNFTFPGCATFSQGGTGNSWYGNAEWITEYNGGKFATWNHFTHTWSYRSSYLQALCASPSQTN